MLKVFCNTCGKEIWQDIAQNLIAAEAKRAVDIECTDCLMKRAYAVADRLNDLSTDIEKLDL